MGTRTTEHLAGFTELEPLDPVTIPKSPDDVFREPLQEITRRLAFDPASWDVPTHDEVLRIFDERAATWHERANDDYRRALGDALRRGGIAAGGRCLDVGSATGLHSAALLAHFGAVVSVDFSIEMLRHAPAEKTARVAADAARLPIASSSCDALVLVNCFLFAPEALRVLRGDGALVFVSTRDDATPIYLPPTEVLSACQMAGPGWRATSAKAGGGRWTVVRRG